MKKSIIVSNMEIAEFMELESKIERMAAINPDTGRVMKCLEEVLCYRIKFAKWVRYDALKYHSSWDALMPVVVKIEKIGETEALYGTLVDISTTYIRIGDIIADRKNTGESIVFNDRIYVDWNEDMSKLDALYKCVIKYINSK